MVGVGIAMNHRSHDMVDELLDSGGYAIYPSILKERRDEFGPRLV